MTYGCNFPNQAIFVYINIYMEYYYPEDRRLGLGRPVGLKTPTSWYCIGNSEAVHLRVRFPGTMQKPNDSRYGKRVPGEIHVKIYI